MAEDTARLPRQPAANPKAAAWEGLGSAYWSLDYDGGPSTEDCDQFLRHVVPGQSVLLVGASTVRLASAALARGAELTVADFSPVMLGELKRVLGDRPTYLPADVTSPGALPPATYQTIVADRLINRFTLAEMRAALSLLTRALRPGGQLRMSYRLGLYDRDLPVLAQARRRGRLGDVFDEAAFDVDYSGAASWLGTVLAPHGRIPMDRLIVFYVRRGREHRLQDGELDDIIGQIGRAPGVPLTVAHAGMDGKPSDRMLIVTRPDGRVTPDGSVDGRPWVRKVGGMSFRATLARHGVVRVAGAHDALGALLAQEAGFDAIWASGLGISAARGLPDASLLTMSDYVEAAAAMQKRIDIPVVADCDTGFGNTLNVAYMVNEYEAAGITAACIEDHQFPKMNSFAPGVHALEDVKPFARKIEVAKSAQSGEEFFLVARTEALIQGLDIPEAVNRCEAYADAGADAVVVHSKARTSIEVEQFLQRWDGRCPVVVIPTTYPHWRADEAFRAGASVVIFANQGLRASVTAQRAAYRVLVEQGSAAALESQIASLSDIFALQRLDEWRGLEG